MTRLYGQTVAGRPVMDMRYAELDPRLCGLGMQRAALFSLLDAAGTQERHLHCGARIVQGDWSTARWWTIRAPAMRASIWWR